MLSTHRLSETIRVHEKPRILTVGPTQEWHARIREQLRTAELETTADGSGGQLLARDWKPHLVIVESVLADMSGIAFARGVREDPELRHLRLLLLSAQSSELDRVLAFECGADDFLPAPFSARELGARVNALLRRELGIRPAAAPPRTEQHGVVRIDADLGRVEVAGRSVLVTPDRVPRPRAPRRRAREGADPTRDRRGARRRHRNAQPARRRRAREVPAPEARRGARLHPERARRRLPLLGARPVTAPPGGGCHSRFGARRSGAHRAGARRESSQRSRGTGPFAR